MNKIGATESEIFGYISDPTVARNLQESFPKAEHYHAFRLTDGSYGFGLIVEEGKSIKPCATYVMVKRKPIPVEIFFIRPKKKNKR